MCGWGCVVWTDVRGVSQSFLFLSIGQGSGQAARCTHAHALGLGAREHARVDEVGVDKKHADAVALQPAQLRADALVERDGRCLCICFYFTTVVGR